MNRALKYLRDIQHDFNVSSILLTTMLGERIEWSDEGATAFADVPTTLKTLISRLDDWMSARRLKPEVRNPHLRHEDFSSSMTQDEYTELRAVISNIRQDVDAAYSTKGRFASISAWQEVFGVEFAKGAAILAKSYLSEEARSDVDEDEAALLGGVLDAGHAHGDAIVDRISRYGRWLWSPSLDRPAHMRPPVWARADIVSDRVYVTAKWSAARHDPMRREIADFEKLPPQGGIWFDLKVNDGIVLPDGYFVRYRVTNTGRVALALGKGRGGFEEPQEGTQRWEVLEFHGVHLVEAFVIRRHDSKLVGQSSPFHVMID
ncbi:nucleotide-binding domain-containing protein [Glacieibacterium megasporae]|uniref:nucleotide-binding domain-containing protein n=1 Tax=Glacieibacterium megasporae TaxID=2835787 RepID=UPI001CAA73E1|nr:hypothetical protein [Polymorphobacter megasporae]UAJ10964.1 hypothetical protein KTC28_04415 [Polymorphobacter megasporae]